MESTKSNTMGYDILKVIAITCLAVVLAACTLQGYVLFWRQSEIFGALMVFLTVRSGKIQVRKTELIDQSTLLVPQTIGLIYIITDFNLVEYALELINKYM